MKKLLIVTACMADNDSQLFRLHKSCELYGLEFAHFGIKQVFRNWKQCKIVALCEFLQTVKDYYEHILFTDGFDSWMLAGEDRIIEKFNKFTGDIVISAEKDCYPHYDWVDKFPPSPTILRFPCAGQFMGKTDKLIEVLSYMSRRFDGIGIDNDDQHIWQTIFLENRFSISIDYTAELFLPMNALDPATVVDTYTIGEQYQSHPIFIESNTQPASIHFNGPKHEKYQRLMDKFFTNTIPS